MPTAEITQGTAEPLRHTHDVNGALVPGSTLVWSVIRESDGLALGAGGTFVTVAAAGSGRFRSLPELTAEPGVYASSFATGAIANPVTPDRYTITISETAPTARVLTTCEVRTVLVPAVQSGMATTSQLSTGLNNVQQTVIDNILALQAYGDTAWTTATLTAAEVAAAVWAVAEGTGTMGAALRRVRQVLTNRRSLSPSGVLSMYADDAVTVLRTVTITDATGGAISLSTGEPARATAET